MYPFRENPSRCVNGRLHTTRVKLMVIAKDNPLNRYRKSGLSKLVPGDSLTNHFIIFL